MKKSSRAVYVNEKQKAFLDARNRKKIFIAGRGSGKSTVLGFHFYQLLQALPRAKGFLAGLTYNQILTKFLPPCTDAWRRIGLKQHIDKENPGHYVIGKKPPSGWRAPFQKPYNYKNTITFFNGFTVEMISMDRRDLSRGGNYDFGVFDEAVLIDRTRHDKELLLAIRGNIHYFPEHQHLHHSRVYVSTQSWLPSGEWISKMGEDPKTFYIESTAWDNIHVLGKAYLDEMKRSLPKLIYDVEVMNKKMKKLPNSFYPEFSELKHCYWKSFHYEETESGIVIPMAGDYNPKKALDVSFDFGGSFNCMIVAQDAGKDYRLVDTIFVTSMIDYLVDEFTQKFAKQERKHVFIYGDRNGNNKNPNSDQTWYQQIQGKLKEAGWTSTLLVQGLDPPHHARHLLINEILSERNPRMPRIRINQNTCKYTIISMQGAPIDDNFKKVKKSERMDIPQEQATHLSDAFDNLIFAKFGESVMINPEHVSKVSFM